MTIKHEDYEEEKECLICGNAKARFNAKENLSYCPECGQYKVPESLTYDELEEIRPYFRGYLLRKKNILLPFCLSKEYLDILVADGAVPVLLQAKIDMGLCYINEQTSSLDSRYSVSLSDVSKIFYLQNDKESKKILSYLQSESYIEGLQFLSSTDKEFVSLSLTVQGKLYVEKLSKQCKKGHHLRDLFKKTWTDQIEYSNKKKDI